MSFVTGEVPKDFFVEYESGKRPWRSEVNASRPIFYASRGFGSEKVSPGRTIPEILATAAKKQPDSPALGWEENITDINELPLVDGRPDVPPSESYTQWKTLSYKEYLEQCSYFGRALIENGFEATQSCSIFGFNSRQWLISQLGAVLAGGRGVGIYPTDTFDQIQFKMDYSNSTVITLDGQRNFNKLKKVIGELELLTCVVSWGKLDSYDSLKGKAGQEVKVVSWEEFIDLGKKADASKLDERVNDQKPGDCCSLIFTSGTTGKPKAVMLSHDNCVFGASQVIKYGFNNDFSVNNSQERVLSYLPLSHVAGMMVDIIAGISATALADGYVTTYFARSYDLKAGTLVERMKAIKPTCFLGVPRVFEKMAEKLQKKLSSVLEKKLIGSAMQWALNTGLEYSKSQNYPDKSHKSWSLYLADKLLLSKVRAQLGLDECKGIFTGAAPITIETLEYLGQFNLKVLEVFGMSECSGIMSWNNNSTHLWGSIGWAMPSTDMRILSNTDDTEVALCDSVFEEEESKQGELCIKGRTVMLGYMANERFGKDFVESIEKKNAETFDDNGYLHTGDKGCKAKDGFMRITGRYKDLLVTAGGENISPLPIENYLKKVCPIISNALMVGDKRKFNVMLLTLKLKGGGGENPASEELEKEDFKYLETDIETIHEAIRDPTVIEEIKRKIVDTNSNGDVVPSNASKVQKFCILLNDFSISTGELTGTLKVKRQFVVDKFHKVIEAMYASKEVYVSFPDELENEIYK